MSKEAEILKTGISYHYTLLPKIKQIKGGHVSQVCPLCCTFLKVRESLVLIAHKKCNEGIVAIK